MLSIPKTTPDARRVHVGVTRKDGTREQLHLVNNGAGALVEQAHAAPPPPDQPDTQTLEPEPNLPALVLEPVRIMDFVSLLVAAQSASRALDRFVQLRDPSGIDLRALERLQAALAPFYPDQPKPDRT